MNSKINDHKLSAKAYCLKNNLCGIEHFSPFNRDYLNMEKNKQATRILLFQILAWPSVTPNVRCVPLLLHLSGFCHHYLPPHSAPLGFIKRICVFFLTFDQLWGWKLMFSRIRKKMGYEQTNGRTDPLMEMRGRICFDGWGGRGASATPQ